MDIIIQMIPIISPRPLLRQPVPATEAETPQKGAARVFRALYRLNARRPRIRDVHGEICGWSHLERKLAPGTMEQCQPAFPIVGHAPSQAISKRSPTERSVAFFQPDFMQIHSCTPFFDAPRIRRPSKNYAAASTAARARRTISPHSPAASRSTRCGRPPLTSTRSRAMVRPCPSSVST